MVVKAQSRPKVHNKTSVVGLGWEIHSIYLYVFVYLCLKK
jgi:hypothetical protein